MVMAMMKMMMACLDLLRHALIIQGSDDDDGDDDNDDDYGDGCDDGDGDGSGDGGEDDDDLP